MTEKSAADRVLELDEKATPGPWCKSGTDCKEEPTEAYIRAISDEMTATVYCAYDADFISEVRTLAPALARQVKELEANRCEHCGAKVSSYPNGCPGCGAPQCCQPCCDLQNARDRVKELEAEREWRPIESAPMDGTHVTVYEPGKVPVTAYYSQAVELYPSLGWQSTPGDKRYRPTHWKPILEPPND